LSKKYAVMVLFSVTVSINSLLKDKLILKNIRWTLE